MRRDYVQIYLRANPLGDVFHNLDILDIGSSNILRKTWIEAVDNLPVLVKDSFSRKPWMVE